MKTLAERLNFSINDSETDTNNDDNMIKIYNNENTNFYEVLISYCDTNNIDLSDVSEADIDGAAMVMQSFNSASLGESVYNFWID